MPNAPSLERGSAFRATRIGAARIGALLLDLAVPLADPHRAPASDGFLQHPALERRGLGREGLHDLTGTFRLEFPLLGLLIVRKRESGQLCHASLLDGNADWSLRGKKRLMNATMHRFRLCFPRAATELFMGRARPFPAKPGRGPRSVCGAAAGSIS